MSKFEFFSLDKDFNLAKNVANHFKKNLYAPNVVKFADSEINLQFKEDININQKEVVVIHSTVYPVNENLLQLIFLIDCLKNMGAAKVHAIIPYFGYSRQCEYGDKDLPGHAGIVAKMLEIAGVDSVAVVEAHDETLASFFSVPFKNIKIDQILAQHIKNNCIDLHDCCLVAPDEGAAKRVTKIGKMLNMTTLFFTKKRCGINKVEIIESSGKIACKSAIIIDDIIDTGGTALKVADILASQEAAHIFGYFIHPVLSGNAIGQLMRGSLQKAYVSDSIALQDNEKVDKIEVFDISQALIDYLPK